jgi:hypothetical protein
VFTNIVGYLSDTKFYNYLRNLFSNNEKIEATNQTTVKNRSADFPRNIEETTRNKESSEKIIRNPKISE